MKLVWRRIVGAASSAQCRRRLVTSSALPAPHLWHDAAARHFPIPARSGWGHLAMAPRPPRPSHPVRPQTHGTRVPPGPKEGQSDLLERAPPERASSPRGIRVRGLLLVEASLEQARPERARERRPRSLERPRSNHTRARGMERGDLAKATSLECASFERGRLAWPCNTPF